MKNNILFYSFRYALGRKTYAVEDVAKEIIDNKKKLDNTTRLLIIKEIKEAEKDNLLAEIDKKTWLNVVEELNNI